MKKLPVLFVLAVSSVLAENPHVGYDYRAPAEPFLPQAHFGAGAGAGAQAAHYNSVQHNYAQHNSAQLAQNRFVPSQNYPYVDDFYRNQYRQPQQGYQINSNYQAPYNSAQSNYQNVNYNSYNQNFANVNSLGIQNGQQNSAYNPRHGNVQTQPQPPVITKHIYFHLPPQDAAATIAPVTAAPPKKTYNIIFIKLPSQKSASAARLQQLINQQAEIENKTLIYVLVKKPETQPVQPITSKPEVFFVKYKDPRNVAQLVNTGPVQVPILQSNGPGLLPGLVNGHGN